MENDGSEWTAALLNKRGRECHARSRGFTLIEILVVVVIVGIVIGAVLPSFNPGVSRAVKDEARRFVALLALASQEAIVTGHELALEIADDAYRFIIFDGQQWAPLKDDVLRERTLPDTVSLEIVMSDGQLVSRNDAREQAARIYILSSGEMTPFEMLLDAPGSDDDYRITGDIAGNLTITAL